MKTDRAAPCNKAVLRRSVPSSRLSSLPVFPAHLSKRPLFFRRRAILQLFSLLATLPGHRAAPGSHPNTPSCCNIRLYDRPRASPSLSANQRPAVLLRRSDFGEFCIVSHETSAFSMFSTCLILLCFCPILVAFLRDFGRKYWFCLFFSLTTDLRLLSSRGSGDAIRDKPEQHSTRNRPTRDPGRRAENARGGRRHGGIAGARPSGIKTGMGGDCQFDLRREWEAVLCAAVQRRNARRTGGVRVCSWRG